MHDARLVGRTAWVLWANVPVINNPPGSLLGPTTLKGTAIYPGSWLDGKITKYYTPEEAQQLATDRDEGDAEFNVLWLLDDGVHKWPLLLWLDLKDYDAPMDKLSEFADGTWYLEEEPCPAASVLAEDAQEAPPDAHASPGVTSMYLGSGCQKW